MTAREPQPREGRAAAWWVGAIAVAAIVVAIGTPLFGIRVFHASDVLTLFAPWRDSYPVEVKAVNSQITDTVDGIVPTRAELKRRIRSGDFPLWNPYPNGGTPLEAVPDIGGLDPLNFPNLFLPTWYSPAFGKLLEMAVAVGFMFLFLRRLGLGKPAALLGGLIYSFSAFQVVWTNWPQPQVGAMFPALFWATERHLQLRTIRSAIPISIVMAALLFGGFPAIVGYAVIALAIYVLARLVVSPNRSFARLLRRVSRVAAAIVLGVGITAIQLVPFIHQVDRTELRLRESVRGRHLPLRTMITMAVPDAFGSPVDRVYYGTDNYVEAESFVGVTALILVGVATLGHVRRRSRDESDAGLEAPPSPVSQGPEVVPGAMGGLWATVVLSVVLVYVGGPVFTAFQRLPFLGLNSIARMRSILGFALAAIAAIGFQKLVSLGPAWVRTRMRGWRSVAVSVFAVGCAYGAWRGWRFADKAGRGGYALRQAALPAAVAVAAILVILLGGRLRRTQRASMLVWIIPLLVAVESVAFAYPFWPRVPREEFYPQTPVHRFLEDHLGHDRFGAENRTMYSGTGSFYALRAVTGHAFQEQTWADLLGAVDPDVFHASRRVPLFAAEDYVATSAILDRLGVRYFVASPEVSIVGEGEFELPQSDGRFELKAGDSIEVPLPGGSLRAIALRLVDVRGLSDDAWIRTEVTDASGNAVASGERRIFPGRKPGELTVAVVGGNVNDAGSRSVRLSLKAARGSVALATGTDGRATVGTVRPADDGLRVVFSGAAVVYERMRALARIRWEGSAVVVRSSRERVHMLLSGVDARRLILSADGPTGSGGTAEVTILEDSGDVVRARVDARGDGYLFVADPIQYGWKATIDGAPAPLVAADHAGAAVHVPAGKHEVSIRYVPPGRRTGMGLTAVSLATVGVVLAATTRRRKRVPDVVV